MGENTNALHKASTPNIINPRDVKEGGKQQVPLAVEQRLYQTCCRSQHRSGSRPWVLWSSPSSSNCCAMLSLSSKPQLPGKYNLITLLGKLETHMRSLHNTPHNKGDIYVLSVQSPLIITIRNSMKREHTKQGSLHSECKLHSTPRWRHVVFFPWLYLNLCFL